MIGCFESRVQCSTILLQPLVKFHSRFMCFKFQHFTPEVRQDDDGEVSLLVACRQRGTAPWRAGTDVDAAVCSSERFGRAVGCSEADSPSASGRRLDG